MQLGESETLGVEDDHDGGVRHIDAHLNNGSGHENLRLSLYEFLHLLFLLAGFHAAVDLAEAELREGLSQHLVAVFKVLEVTLLRLFDEREDDIHLAPLTDLLTDAVVE